MNKIKSRVRRAAKTKALIRKSDKASLVVFRSNIHIYAQIVKLGTVLASASTIDQELKSNMQGKTKVEQATMVGALVAERALKAGVLDVAFDRSGYKFHGRVKALAEGARKSGLNF